MQKKYPVWNLPILVVNWFLLSCLKKNKLFITWIMLKINLFNNQYQGIHKCKLYSHGIYYSFYTSTYCSSIHHDPKSHTYDKSFAFLKASIYQTCLSRWSCLVWLTNIDVRSSVVHWSACSPVSSCSPSQWTLFWETSFHTLLISEDNEEFPSAFCCLNKQFLCFLFHPKSRIWFLWFLFLLLRLPKGLSRC